VKIGQGNVNHLSISRYSDLEKISSSVCVIHFRKFTSEKIIKWILENHLQVKKISFSKYVYSKCNSSIFNFIKQNNVKIVVQNKGPGRPNLLEAIRL